MVLPTDATDHVIFRQRPLNALGYPGAPLISFPAIPFGGITLLLSVALCFFLYGTNRAQYFSLFVPAGAVLCGLSVLWMIGAVVEKVRVIRAYRRAFLQIGEDLKDLRFLITDYIASLDKRTRRYFHCVTNTKVTNYFMLKQIEEGLTLLIDEYSESTKRIGTPRNLRRSHDIIRRPFGYRDGFEFNSGNLHEVSLIELRQRVMQLMQDLQRGMRDVEEEIVALSTEMIRNADNGPRIVE